MIIRQLSSPSTKSPLIQIQRIMRSLRDPKTAPDELLLHSGGPISDISQSSLLMGPPTHRTLFRQPENEASFLPEQSPLDGILTFHSPNPLIVEQQIWRNSKWETIETLSASNLSEAMRITYQHTCLPVPDGMPSIGSVAGLLGYDLVQWTSPVELHAIPEQNTILGIIYRISAYIFHNRSRNTLHLVAENNHPWADITNIDPVESSQHKVNSSLSRPESTSDQHHSRKISQIIESIRGGHLYQVNYGRTWRGKTEIPPWIIFEELDNSNPAPYSAWLDSPDLDIAIVSSSPELLLEMDSSSVYTRPIKGTRPRGEGIDADRAEIMSMIRSRKEIAEHMMLVDLERNDIRKITQPGTTRWTDWRVESLSNVHHLVSTIQGDYRENLDVAHALQALFPGGSITGCPKDATIAAISWLEEEPRGAWTGSIGYLDPLTSNSIWNILIRTIEFHTESNEWAATIKAGGGITVESNPASEVDEAKLKAMALIDACWPNIDSDIISPTVSAPSSIQSIKPVDERTKSLLERLNSESSGNTLNAKENSTHVLFIDNLDSFTWNIVDELRICGSDVTVVPGRGPGSHVTVKELLSKHNPTHIVIGPGPSTPEASPLTMAFATWALENPSPLPTLGLCLGHQALGIAAGWKLGRTSTGAVHGVPTRIQHVSSGLFEDIEPSPVMMRYHSLSLEEPKSLENSKLRSNAWLEPAGIVMGVQALNRPVHGVQFHPESCGSPEGRLILKKFLTLTRLEQNQIHQAK